MKKRKRCRIERYFIWEVKSEIWRDIREKISDRWIFYLVSEIRESDKKTLGICRIENEIINKN